MKNRLVWGLALCWIITIVVRLVYLKLPLDNDEGAYAYISSVWLHGYSRPYIDVFDHKMPLVYILYSPAAIFNFSIIGIRLLGIFLGLLTVSLFYIFFVRVLGRRWGVMASNLLALYYSSYGLEGIRMNVENLSLPFLGLVLVVGITSDRWKDKIGIKKFILAVLVVAGFFLKPVIGLFFLACLSISGREYFRGKRIVLFICMIGALVGGVFGMIKIFGGWEEFYQANFIYNSLYARYSWMCGRACGGVGQTLNVLFTWGNMHLLLIFVVNLLGIIWLIKSNNINRRVLMFCGWIGLGYIYSRLGGFRLYAHYFLFISFGLVGLSCEFLKIAEKRWGEEKTKFMFLMLVGFFVIWEYVSGPVGAKFRPFQLEYYWYFRDKAALDVSENLYLLPSDKLLVYANEPEIYVYLHRRAVDRNINMYEFRYKYDQLPQWRKNMWQKNFDFIVTYSEQSNNLIPERVPWEWQEMKDYDIYYRNEYFLVFKRRANQI